MPQVYRLVYVLMVLLQRPENTPLKSRTNMNVVLMSLEDELLFEPLMAGVFYCIACIQH